MRQGGTSLLAHGNPSLSSATSCNRLEAKATYREHKYAVFPERIKTDLSVSRKECEDRANFIEKCAMVNDSQSDFWRYQIEEAVVTDRFLLSVA